MGPAVTQDFFLGGHNHCHANWSLNARWIRGQLIKNKQTNKQSWPEDE